MLIVDDHVAVREGLARLLRSDPLCTRVVATASTPQEALHEIRICRPHVVVLDVDLAGADGLALLPQIVDVARVVVLSCHGDAETRRRAAWLGAHAFIEKSEPATVLLAQLSAFDALREG